MVFQDRQYQTDAIQSGINYFQSKQKTKTRKNAILILPTGSGKSVVIAKILNGVQGNTIVLQPSKEILEQNFEKFIKSGGYANIYSASIGEKRIGKITFCTIGSIIEKLYLFEGTENILIDECHLVNAKGGMYEKLISYFSNAKVLGLTATPYRLSNDSYGAQLKFITRTRPKIFHDVLYFVQNSVLFDAGYLAKLQYYSFDVVDRSKLEVNSSGTDFTTASLNRLYKSIDMPGHIVRYAKKILAKRNNILIFCAMIEEATIVTRNISGAVILTGETKTKDRERILMDFKKGRIKCLVNVGVLTTGFDFPGLESVLIARSTMSLALYYQIVGRVMRIFTYPDGTKKEGWIIDLGGNINFFGKIETMIIKEVKKGLFSIWNNGKQLTNVPLIK